MDALEAFGDYRPRAQQAGAFGRPVAGRALAVVATGDDDQRHTCGAVAGSGLVDRHHLAARLMPGPSPAPVGNHLVLDADVREGAAYHDVMIDTAGREEIGRAQVCTPVTNAKLQ